MVRFMSSGLSRELSEISSEGFDMLPPMPPKRKPAKRKARKKSKHFEQSDYQKWLEEIVLETGLTGEQFEARSEKLGRKIPASSLRSTLRTTSTLSFKVIEYIALTCGKSPLYVLARGLDDPPEEQLKGFEGSLLETAWNLYKDLDDEDRQRIDRYTLQPLIAEMREKLIED